MQISEARFFLIAAGLHGVLPVMAAIVPAPAIEDTSVPIEVEIQVQVDETRPPTIVETPAARVETPRNTAEETPIPRPEQRPTNVPAPHVEPGPAPTVAPTGDPQATGSPGVEPAPGPAATGTSEYTTPAPMVQTPGGTGLPGLGINGQAWAIPGVVPDMGRPAPAPTVAPKATVDPKIATKVLTDAVKEKDKALGLDLPAGGTIASSVRSAVQATDTPPESRASFEVKLSPTGQVLSVRVASSSGGSTEVWARAAAAVKAALAGRTLAMTSGYEKGAVVYVNVSSALALPDGTKSAIQRKGAGATFDVANIGAHMQRVVKTSFSVVAVK